MVAVRPPGAVLGADGRSRLVVEERASHERESGFVVTDRHLANVLPLDSLRYGGLSRGQAQCTCVHPQLFALLSEERRQLKFVISSSLLFPFVIALPRASAARANVATNGGSREPIPSLAAMIGVRS